MQTPSGIARFGWLWPAALGAGLFVGAHALTVALWRFLSDDADPHHAWWLGSALAILPTTGLLFIGATLACALREDAPWRTALSMEAGTMAGMTGVLFAIGPGTIFPLVLLAGLVLSSMAVFGGVVAGWLARTVWSRRHAPG